MSVKSLLTLASISQPDASGHMKPSEAVAVKTPEPQFSFNVGNVENSQVSNTSVCFWLVQGVRSATLYSPLSADSLFVRGEQPLTVSLGFKSTDRYGSLLRSSSQVNPPCLTSSFKRESKAKLRWLNILWSSTGLPLCPRLPAVPAWWLCSI